MKNYKTFTFEEYIDNIEIRAIMESIQIISIRRNIYYEVKRRRGD